MAASFTSKVQRALAAVLAAGAIALCADAPAYAATPDGNVTVSVPTQLSCALLPDGGVVTPSGATVSNGGTQAMVASAHTADTRGHSVDFGITLDGSSLLTRRSGKDTASDIDMAGGRSTKVGLDVADLDRVSNAALMDAAAQGETTMFTVGWKFEFKALQGTVSISGDAKLGKTLTVSVSGAQADAQLGYRWYRDGKLIAGADGASYTTRDEDVDKMLKCEVYDAGGKYVGTVSGTVGPVKGPEAFAVFSADDGSLNFYKRSTVPAVGSQFEGKTATSVYSDFEDKAFDQVWTGTNTCVPWADVCSKVTNATFVDTIQPKNMAWWFHAMPKLTSVDFTNLDASQCVSFKRIFSSDVNLVNFIGMNELDTSSLVSVAACFDGCHKITDNSMCEDWDVSNIEYWGSMFYNTPKLSSFDASKWRVAKTPSDDPTVSPFMFGGTSSYSPVLRISVSESASINLKSTLFFDTHKADISGADGYWYDQATGDAYLPADIPSNKAATYVAVNSVMAPTVTIEGEAIYGSTLTAKVSGQPAGTTATSYQWQWSHDGKAWNDSQYANAKTDSITLVNIGVDDSPMHNYYRCVVTTTAGLKRVPQGVSAAVGPVMKPEAFAVYSADDNSLSFYKRGGMPAEGSQFEGKTATEVYTGFEEDVYSAEEQVPWYPVRSSIITGEVVDVIKPVSTAYWFTRWFDVTSLDVSNLDTSRVNNMSSMFAWCSTLTTLDVTNLDTSKVTDMSNMFNKCRALTSLDLSSFDTSKVKTMSGMFDGCWTLQQVKLGEKLAWKSANGYLPAQMSDTVAWADGKWYAASDGKGYAPEDIPSNKADTYYASKSLLPAATLALTDEGKEEDAAETSPEVTGVLALEAEEGQGENGAAAGAGKADGSLPATVPGDEEDADDEEEEDESLGEEPGGAPGDAGAVLDGAAVPAGGDPGADAAQRHDI